MDKFKELIESKEYAELSQHARYIIKAAWGMRGFSEPNQVVFLSICPTACTSGFESHLTFDEKDIDGLLKMSGLLNATIASVNHKILTRLNEIDDGEFDDD